MCGSTASSRYQRADLIHLHVAQRHVQVKVGGAHGAVGAGAVHGQVDAAVDTLDVRRSVVHGVAIGGVQRQRVAAAVLGHKGVQRFTIACADHDPRAQAVQARRRGAADAGGRTHQPHGAAGPAFDAGVQGHEGVITSW
jgi:hypothetical protein